MSTAQFREETMEAKAESHFFKTDGDIPNSLLPLLLYRAVLAAPLQTPGGCQSLFSENDWGGNWVDGILDYWHFHVTGHEVLGCVAGEAEVGFGGDAGIEVTVSTGDVVVIPAGVGHKRLSAKRHGFTIVGGYPPGQSGMISQPGDFSMDEAKRRIAALALPKSDPVSGPAGPLLVAWKLG